MNFLIRIEKMVADVCIRLDRLIELLEDKAKERV
jgi:hypothetical protein